MRKRSCQIRIAQDSEDLLGQRACLNWSQKPSAGAAQEVLVIAEVGRHDRAAGGKINGDLALNRVVLTTGQTGMNQNIGPSRERDDLIGGLAGQNDQSFTVPAELGTVTLAGLGGTADQDTARFRP